MVASPDFQDFTQGSSRLMQQLAGSPVASSAAGVNSVTLLVPDFARSLNLLVTAPDNVITLTVVGATTGFAYLNAVPAYDGGIYYLPAMPVVDNQVTITWYQVLAAAVSIYAIASDEPISVSLFNPISPTQATSERLAPYTPRTVASGVGTNFNATLDATTRAIRVTIDNPNNYTSGKIVGSQSGIVYFNGEPTGTKFPITPIPVDNTQDTTVNIEVTNIGGFNSNVYVALVNVPDFAGSLPITHKLSPNELAPDPRQSQTPNQLPATFNGSITNGASQVLVAAVANMQLRIHQITLTTPSTAGPVLALEDTNGNVYWKDNTGVAHSIVVPLFAQVAPLGTGFRLNNIGTAITGAIAVTLWHSVL